MGAVRVEVCHYQAGNPRLLPLQLAACAGLTWLTAGEQEALVASGREIGPLFA